MPAFSRGSGLAKVSRCQSLIADVRAAEKSQIDLALPGQAERAQDAVLDAVGVEVLRADQIEVASPDAPPVSGQASRRQARGADFG